MFPNTARVIAEDSREGRHPGEGGEGSENDMDGNEDLGGQGQVSHCGESGGSRVAAAAGGETGLPNGAGLFAGTFELVVSNRFG